MKNYFLFSLCMLFVFTACDKDDPMVPDEPEVITTLNYTLTPVGGGAAVVLRYSDADGDGGQNPIVTGGTLAANQVYNGTLVLLNESVDPIDDITSEIAEEAIEHQFFFVSTIAGLSIEYTDQDSEGNPLGLASSLTTGATGSGNLTIILRHEPVKDAEGVAGGDVTNADGETDIEVVFPIDVQ